MTLYMHPDAANGLSFERETRGASVNFRHYITVGGMVVGEIVTTAASPSSGTTRYFHYDHLGSVVAVSDDGGNVIERRSFDAWGRPRATTGAPGTGELPNGLDEATDRGFTLSEHLEGLGLIHMNGRVYDPTIARFASPDPTVTHADDLQSFNRFAYVENRPLDSTDPTGFEPAPTDAGSNGNPGPVTNYDGINLQTSTSTNDQGAAKLINGFNPNGGNTQTTGTQPASQGYFTQGWSAVSSAFSWVTTKYDQFITWHPTDNFKEIEQAIGHSDCFGARECVAHDALKQYATETARDGARGVTEANNVLTTLYMATAPELSSARADVAVVKAIGVGSRAPQTFEIIDGVRRSVTAAMLDSKTIMAEVRATKSSAGVIREIPVQSLLSPEKAAIDVSTDMKMSRFMNIFNLTKSGSPPPPIIVTPGGEGTPISQVILDYLGSH